MSWAKVTPSHRPQTTATKSIATPMRARSKDQDQRVKRETPVPTRPTGTLRTTTVPVWAVGTQAKRSAIILLPGWVMKILATPMRRKLDHILTDTGKPQKMVTQSLSTMVKRRSSTNPAARVSSPS